MGWLSDTLAKIRGDEDDETPIAERPLDMSVRGPQLVELRSVLEDLVAVMEADTAKMDNPGWRGRSRDYAYALGGVRETLRNPAPTRDALYEVLGSVRPMYRGPVPAGYEALVAPTERLLAVLAELRQPLASE